MAIALLVIACIAALIAAFIYRENRIGERQIRNRELNLATDRHQLRVYIAETARMKAEHDTDKEQPTYSPGDTRAQNIRRPRMSVYAAQGVTLPLSLRRPTRDYH